MSYEMQKNVGMLLGCAVGGAILASLYERRIKEIKRDAQVALSEMHEGAFNNGWRSATLHHRHPHPSCDECHPPTTS